MLSVTLKQKYRKKMRVCIEKTEQLQLRGRFSSLKEIAGKDSNCVQILTKITSRKILKTRLKTIIKLIIGAKISVYDIKFLPEVF